MCNGSQMGSKPTSSREQVDIAKTVYTLKIRGGCEVDSYGKKAGKGALINENMAMTLGVSQDQTLFVPRGQRQAYCIGNGQVHDLGMDKVCKTLNCMDDPMKVIVEKTSNLQ